MSEIPEPPKWPRENVKLNSEAEDKLTELANEFFSEGFKGGESINEIENINYVSRGTSRVVVEGDCLPNNCVAKISIEYRGTKKNEDEYFMEENNHDIFNYTTPILNSSREQRWIITENCQTGDRECVRKMRAVLDYYDIKYDEIELAPTNVGYYNSQPCMIDWAMILWESRF